MQRICCTVGISLTVASHDQISWLQLPVVLRFTLSCNFFENVHLIRSRRLWMQVDMPDSDDFCRLRVLVSASARTYDALLEAGAFGCHLRVKRFSMAGHGGASGASGS